MLHSLSQWEGSTDNVCKVDAPIKSGVLLGDVFLLSPRELRGSYIFCTFQQDYISAPPEGNQLFEIPS